MRDPYAPGTQPYQVQDAVRRVGDKIEVSLQALEARIANLEDVIIFLTDGDRATPQLGKRDLAIMMGWPCNQETWDHIDSVRKYAL